MLTDLQLLDPGILARVAEHEEKADSYVDGRFETSNIAYPGDYIIHGTRGEEYVIQNDTAADKLDLERGPSCVPAEIEGATALMEAGFRLYSPPYKLRIFVEVEDGDISEGEFLASWGSPTTVEVGDYILAAVDGEHSFREAYRISREDTYTEVVEEAETRPVLRRTA